jgi:hypothetical protein
MEWGDNARAAGEKEVNQLHWRETFNSRQMSELTAEQQTKILQSHMFIRQKRTGETKVRMVTGGNTQRGHVTKEEFSSIYCVHRGSPIDINCQCTQRQRRRCY